MITNPLQKKAYDAVSAALPFDIDADKIIVEPGVSYIQSPIKTHDYAARCAMWFNSLGIFDKNAPAPTGEEHRLLAPDTVTAQTPYGELFRLAPPVQFSETKPYWRDPLLVVRGSSKAAWTTI